MVSRFIDRIVRLWRGRWFHYFNGLVEVESLADVPQTIPPHVVYIVTSGGHVQWLAFTCPCGCARRILLPLSPSRWPHWSVHWHGERVTLSPSVDAHDCGAHFFIRDGSIVWCGV